MKRLWIFCLGITSLWVSMLISTEPSHALTDVEIACLSINNFPSDLGQIWPIAVKKHYANPDNVTAA